MALKNEILKFLEQNKNNSISGQDLADKLKVSRTAVWKAINLLKNEGYSINSVNNKGYKLNNNDKIYKEGIELYLNNQFKNLEIEVYDKIDSTNNEAKRRINNKTYPDVIISETQLNGRGRYGKSFYSENNGVYMTIILSPNLNIDSAKLITCSTAICVCKSIENLSKKTPEIKWVNDILLDNKKICGILTEAITDFESGCVEKIIIGIGINCNTDINLFPKEIQKIAGSINLLPISRNQLIAEIINNIMSEIFNSPQKIISEYKNRSMMLNKEIVFYKDNKKIEGIVIDINNDCNLIIKTKNENLIINSGIVEIKGLYQ